MKSTYRLAPRIVASLLVIFCLQSSVNSRAESIENTKDQCVDVLLVFARGSSQNEEHKLLNNPYHPDFKDLEQEGHRFFATFKEHLDRDYPHVTYKAHSLHNFENKYNPVGYEAVGIFGKETLGNMFEAEWFWAPGSYRNSVKNGQEELTGFVKDEISRCSDQKIVLGGYSQGAHVVGDSLFDLTDEERQHISFVALFGDPKYVGTSNEPFNPFDKIQSYPWRRGTAKDEAGGIADARYPYVPGGMENKVLSWCFDDDYICSGVSGLKGLKDGISLENAGIGHTRYKYFGVQQAAVEIVQTMAPELYAIERNGGGVSKDSGPTQPVPYQPSTKPIDFMFLVNTSYDVNDVLWQLRLATPQVMTNMAKFFTARYAVADFYEVLNGGELQPVISPLRQTFKPFENEPNNLEWNFVRKLNNGNLSGGGVDPADPHILAIERFAQSPAWDKNATRHMVLITDRPMKENYTYNICSNIIRTGFGILEDNKCVTAPGTEEGLTTYHPEICDSAWLAMTRDKCVLNINAPTATHEISRTLDDAIKVARANNIAISVVVPHPIPHPVDKTATERQLENLANSTGGLFIKYDVFNQASYTDMMWQILNHEPKIIELTYKDTLESMTQDSTQEPVKKVLAKTHVPVVLDASAGGKTYSKYHWDFDGDGSWDETSLSPVVQHTFDEPSQGAFLSVEAINDAEEAEAVLTLPVSVESFEYSEDTLHKLSLPDNLEITKSTDSLSVSWDETDDFQIFFLGDPVTGMPIVSAPASQGSVVLPLSNLTDDNLLVWTVSEDGMSEREIVQTGKGSSDDKKVIDFESAPWSQFVESVRSDSVEQVATTSGTSTDGGQVAGAATDIIAQGINAPQPRRDVSDDEAQINQNKSEVGKFITIFTAAGGILFIICGIFYIRKLAKDSRRNTF